MSVPEKLKLNSHEPYTNQNSKSRRRVAPLVAFAAFGSSRYLVVASDSATAATLAGGLAGLATAGSAQYVSLAGLVALLTAGFLLLARLLKLGFLADFLSRTVLIGFLTGVGFQVGIAVLNEMLNLTGVPRSLRGDAPFRSCHLEVLEKSATLPAG
jgi:MFS superfamily sulfate permease-like transporter